MQTEYTFTISAPPPTSFIASTPLNDAAGWGVVADTPTLHAVVHQWTKDEPERLRAVMRDTVIQASRMLQQTLVDTDHDHHGRRRSTMSKAGGERPRVNETKAAAKVKAEAAKPQQLAQLQLLHEVASIPANHHALTLDALEPVVQLLQGADDLDVREACVRVLWLLCSTNDAILDDLVRRGIAGKRGGGWGGEGSDVHVVHSGGEMGW